jgi:glycosyltransferase involved in cell wall biosynthesis
MNIGIVSVWADCGAGYVSRAYARILEQAHRVFIYARGTYLSGKGDPYWDGPQVTWDRSTGWITRFNWRQYRHWLQQNQIDLVLFNEQRWWGAVIGSRRMGVSTVAYVDYYTADTVPLFHLYDGILCNTKRHYSVFKNFPEAHFVAWGSAINLFKPGPRWGSRQKDVIFFHSAGLGGPNDRKGTGKLIEAFCQVNGPARLIIHSQIALQDFPKDWKEQIDRNSAITVIEGTIKPPGYFARGDLYVYPTRLEGIGLSLVEALSCGLPVITTNNAPMNEFVRDGVNGRLVEVDQYLGRSDGYFWPESLCSVKALVQCMQDYIDHPEKILQQQIQARELAVKYNDWDKNAASLSELFEEIHRKRKTHEIPADLIRLARRLDSYNEPSVLDLYTRAIRLQIQNIKSTFRFLKPKR